MTEKNKAPNKKSVEGAEQKENIPDHIAKTAEIATHRMEAELQSLRFLK